MSPNPQLAGRVPAVILIVVITITSILDWVLGWDQWMMVPAEVVEAWNRVRAGEFTPETAKALATTTTSEFLHGGLGHLFSNSLMLWIFGAVICELCGWRWMLVVFIVGGIGGSVGQILINPESTIPTLGASGGLMAMEGFYFGLAMQHPRQESHVWPVSRPVSSGQLAAFGAIAVFLDFIGYIDGMRGIAYGAHIGGFITGMAISFLADRFVR